MGGLLSEEVAVETCLFLSSHFHHQQHAICSQESVTYKRHGTSQTPERVASIPSGNDEWTPEASQQME